MVAALKNKIKNIAKVHGQILNFSMFFCFWSECQNSTQHNSQNQTKDVDFSFLKTTYE